MYLLQFSLDLCSDLPMCVLVDFNVLFEVMHMKCLFNKFITFQMCGT